MIKALVFSDSHKQFSPMFNAIEKESPINWLIHAGDMHSDVEDLMTAFPKTPFAYVKGNNDFFLPNVPDERFFELEGVKIFLTHGHMFGVKSSLFGLLKKAKELEADLVIFGHTHKAFHEVLDGITLFNPGHARQSYGVLTLSQGTFEIELKEI